jgi:hypothetical protein
MDINCQVLVALQWNAMIPTPVSRLLFPFPHLKLVWIRTPSSVEDKSILLSQFIEIGIPKTIMRAFKERKNVVFMDLPKDPAPGRI